MIDERALRAQRHERVAVYQIDNAERRNALSPGVLHALAEALTAADADDDVRCIVVAGSEKVFASGADLRALYDAADLDAYLTPRFSDWDTIRRVRTPLVAAVSGYCLGGGCELALSCDVIVAAPSAVFGLPETSLGLIPGAGGTQLLSRLIGAPKALDVILSGRLLSAEEAERAGLVSRIAPQRRGSTLRSRSPRRSRRVRHTRKCAPRKPSAVPTTYR